MQSNTPTLVSVLVLAVLLPASVASDVSMSWSPGWDVLNRPLSYSRSFVSVYHPDASSEVHIRYHLQGAVPNTTHSVGVHLFWGPAGTNSTGMCLNTLGQFTASGCAFTCRQSTCRTYNSFELCNLSTDANGNGECIVVVQGLALLRYELQYMVRDSEDPESSVIYQTPGPYGNGTVSFTIP